MKTLKDYGYGWVIGAFFLGSIAIFLVTGWYVYVDDQAKFGLPPNIGEWAMVMTRDAFENIQSEMLQLLMQVGLLAYLLWRGSPQSKDSQERLEQKVDEIRRRLDQSPPTGTARWTGS